MNLHLETIITVGKGLAIKDAPAPPTTRGINMSEDPWIHRSARMRCSTCHMHVAKPAPVAVTGAEPKQVGRCRRHAPTMTGYPVVFSIDWCGDHKLNEECVA
jgi:hypothetical protein